MTYNEACEELKIFAERWRVAGETWVAERESRILFAHRADAAVLTTAEVVYKGHPTKVFDETDYHIAVRNIMLTDEEVLRLIGALTKGV